MSININEWSKVAMAFAVGVSLSAGYVALGMQSNASPTVIVEEHCAERAPLQEAAPVPPTQEQLAPELVRDPPYYDLSEARLTAMVEGCELRDDHPSPLDDKTAKVLGLDADEREAWSKALAGLEGKEAAMHFILLKEIDAELDITKMKVDEQRALLAERVKETKRPEDEAVFKHLAQERAGQRPVPTKSELRAHSAWYRYQRHQLTVGDRFAALLAKDIGEQRTEELRRTFKGWPGGEGEVHKGCEEQAELSYTSSDGLDKSIIRRIVRAHIGSIRECYNQGLDDNPQLAGKVVISFVVGPDGKVSQSSVAEGTDFEDDKSALCMADAAKDWVFPRPKDGEKVIITYPFNLEPG